MREHERIAQKIDLIYKLISEIDDRFLVAQLANYTCILIAGYLERALIDVIVIYCEKRATPQVAAFAAAQISRFQNPSSEKVIKILGAFGEPIQGRTVDALSDPTSSAIDSIVSNRNNLAHGRNATVTFTMLRGWDQQIRAFVSDLQQKVLV